MQEYRKIHMQSDADEKEGDQRWELSCVSSKSTPTPKGFPSVDLSNRSGETGDICDQA
jgi:hypothetical protein